MNKPGSLRAAIAAAAPELKTSPDKFNVFIDGGTIVSISTSMPSFEYRCTINLILLDFAGDADQVFIALLAWVRTNQPDLMDNDTLRQSAIKFEVDHLNNETCDISITLPLTESVRVTRDAAGAYQVQHLQEPVPDWRTTGSLVAL
ncbi:phage tail protein [Pseudoduganella sp. FT55W]|uniref:Phage tail protein n=1 Tax=Duganella rivi TaxID=2666083 RepID=A0A7X4GVQ0_9BURK|nr:phage tail protein [Duganella rivi]MYM70530.1 phage tail protein [Duganella rivi]